MATCIQLTGDGLKVYGDAVEDSFGADIDHSMLEKIHGNDAEGDQRYRPGQCIGTMVVPIMGDPDPKHASTSYVERQHLARRMPLRRFTRLTSGFSKKVENLATAAALHFVKCNFVRIHQTLPVAPAIAADLTDQLWSVEDSVDRWEDAGDSNWPTSPAPGH